MGRVVIKKRVNLDFLGEDYKDAYVVFKSLPIKEYEGIIGAVEKGTEKENMGLIRQILKDKFLEGKFPDEKGEAFDLKNEDVDDFDVETATRIFAIFQGRAPDPK